MAVNEQENIVIVGGGYLGAMSALLFSQCKDFKVTLIEKQDRLGGLYNSAWSKDGYHFDYGSRAILATGVDELDGLLFSILPDDEYPKAVANLKEFSFQAGARREYSNCLDARTLLPKLFERGVKELLAINAADIQGVAFANLGQFALATYGPTLTEHTIRPVMEKLTGLKMGQLDPAALALHGLHRIIVADEEESKCLKAQSTFNDGRIAYAKYDNNKSTLIKTYPRTAGMQDFGKSIQTYLEDASNVDVVLGTSATGVEIEDNDITGLVLEDGSKVACRHVLWTIPSIFLARLLDIDVSSIKPPVFRNMVLAHYVFSGNVKTSAYFMYNYDPSYMTFRTSFYDNFTERPKQHRSATVEMFHDAPDPEMDKLKTLLFEELKAMDCVSADSDVVEAQLQFQRNAMPAYASEFFDRQIKANRIISGQYANLHLLGRANGKHHSSALVHSAFELYQELTG